MDNIYISLAQESLLKKGIEDIGLLYSDRNNYTFKAIPSEFYKKNILLRIGQKVTYDDGVGYALATRVIKLTTHIDYPCEQEITVGNQVIKGSITQLKEDVQSIIAVAKMAMAVRLQSSNSRISYEDLAVYISSPNSMTTPHRTSLHSYRGRYSAMDLHLGKTVHHTELMKVARLRCPQSPPTACMTPRARRTTGCSRVRRATTSIWAQTARVMDISTTSLSVRKPSLRPWRYAR